jgi:uncharacterized protein
LASGPSAGDGSIPASAATLLLLAQFDLNGQAARGLITTVLCAALLVTALVLVFRRSIVAFYRTRVPKLDPQRAEASTVVVGAILGAMISVFSVGAGAVGAMGLIMLYPRMPMQKIVGSDIAHAVPLTLLAGVGHWMMNSVDWHIVGSLLVGSLPGNFVGSYFSIRIPEQTLRAVLATTFFGGNSYCL